MLPTIKCINLLSFAPILRDSLSQSENVLDFHRLIRENRVVLINLNVGSPDAMRLLGCLAMVYAEMAAKLRGQTRAERRRGTHMFIVDEFQNFVAQSNDALGAILEECRKYGLFLCLAHQYWGQVPEGIRRALDQCELEVTLHLEQADAQISAEALGLPYVFTWRKPTSINLLSKSVPPLNFIAVVSSTISKLMKSPALVERQRDIEADLRKHMKAQRRTILAQQEYISQLEQMVEELLASKNDDPDDDDG